MLPIFTLLPFFFLIPHPPHHPLPKSPLVCFYQHFDIHRIMMLPIKTLFPFFILPLSTLAQTILNPVACTLICIQKSLSVTSCEQAQNGVSNQSELPCLCGDNVFLRETINCIINLGECIYSPFFSFHPRYSLPSTILSALLSLLLITIQRRS